MPFNTNIQRKTASCGDDRQRPAGSRCCGELGSVRGRRRHRRSQHGAERGPAAHGGKGGRWRGVGGAVRPGRGWGPQQLTAGKAQQAGLRAQRGVEGGRRGPSAGRGAGAVSGRKGPLSPRVPPRATGQTCVLSPGQGAGMTTPQLPVPTPCHPARFSHVLPGLAVSCWRWTVSGGPRGTGPTPLRMWGPAPRSRALGGPRLCHGAGLTHGLRSSPSAVGRADCQSKMVWKSAVRAGSAAASRAARVGCGSRWCSRARAAGGNWTQSPSRRPPETAAHRGQAQR